MEFEERVGLSEQLREAAIFRKGLFEKACLDVLEKLPTQFPYYFIGVLLVHGELNVLIKDFTSDGTVPHPVHLREGMVVRNAMREVEFFDMESDKEDVPDHYFDDNWCKVVQTFLRLEYGYKEGHFCGKEVNQCYFW